MKKLLVLAFILAGFTHAAEPKIELTGSWKWSKGNELRTFHSDGKYTIKVMADRKNRSDSLIVHRACASRSSHLDTLCTATSLPNAFTSMLLLPLRDRRPYLLDHIISWMVSHRSEDGYWIHTKGLLSARACSRGMTGRPMPSGGELRKRNADVFEHPFPIQICLSPDGKHHLHPSAHL